MNKKIIRATLIKHVTKFNKKFQDWGGEYRFCYCESKTATTITELNEFLNTLGLELNQFEKTEDDTLTFNQLEKEDGYPEKTGKYLADYELITTIYTKDQNQDLQSIKKQ
jgi:hypothetical protein